MPNIASVLKEEIARVARKEMRNEMAALRTADAAHRAEILALKRRAQELEKQLRALLKPQRKKTSEALAEPQATAIRFSAKGLISQRRRLALSAEDCGLLVGASGQSIYNWEAGKARPRTAHLAAIAALKRLGKKDAVARLEAAREAG